MIIKDFRYNTEQDINNIVANNNDDSKQCYHPKKVEKINEQMSKLWFYIKRNY